ncbi:CLCA_X family protein [Marinospirillum sp.]|uniref:CLCA_X family protein n=1 Tax=Marinospirillum sp. TaxID=2183934 RepID=UPI0028703F8A|nr:CLCA_X family protein [Marinospirillum sp.]MDR9468594.1 CLCA_X family protein [Marinospirillum sp.]
MLSLSPVTFLTIRKQYDFRTIEIGRWVTPAERDRAAVNFHRALGDLMATLQGPETLISLRGHLGLQYGIGGRPGVAAHYIPASRQLALAKNAGAGSLAHEWFHALDHYLADKAFKKPGGMAFASSCWLNNQSGVPHPINSLLNEGFKAILLDETGNQPSSLFQCSKRADQKLGVLYYARPEEVCARAFEAFVEDTGPHNAFLVRGTRFSEEAKAGLYPQGEERQRINQAFREYFSTLGAALNAGSRD